MIGAVSAATLFAGSLTPAGAHEKDRTNPPDQRTPVAAPARVTRVTRATEASPVRMPVQRIPARTITAQPMPIQIQHDIRPVTIQHDLRPAMPQRRMQTITAIRADERLPVRHVERPIAPERTVRAVHVIGRPAPLRVNERPVPVHVLVRPAPVHIVVRPVHAIERWRRFF
ncbi:MAG: hypothetical protein DLM50_07350, partial [Candidatus Meridianibacter frigidus]